MTLSVGADEQRGRNIFNLSDGTARVGGAPTNTRSGEEHPNPWIALQINQAWGRATAAFVAQEARATYYTGTPGVVGSGCPAGAQSGTSQCFYPDDKWGWAAKVGLELKTPWIAPGDRLGLTANYSVGFVRYALSNTNNPGLFGSGNQTTLGFVTDAVYSNGTQMELTTAWSATAAYEHYWTPQFSTTVYGGYGKVEYNDTVVADGRFCKPGQIILLSGQACDPSFSLFQVGSHTDWFPASGFRLAVDVMFTGINTAMEGQARLGQVRGLRPTGVYTIKDEGIWAGMFRAQRSFPAGGD